MKKIFNTLACLSAVLLAFSCVMDEIDTQITDEEAIAQIRLECDALESYTIQSQKPQAISFRVNSTTPWTITGFENSGWLTVEPASSSVSSLSEDVTVKAIANTELSERSVTLKVSGKNTDISYSVRITQARMGKVTVEPIANDFTAAGGSQTFNVQYYVAWEASAADEWLTLSPASGTSDGQMKTTAITATAAANTGLSRSTTITVVSGDDITQFLVKQAGHTLEFVTQDDYSVPSKGGELLLGVTATMDWKVESDNADFTATKVNDSQVKVTAAFNNKFVARTAKISVKPMDSSMGDFGGTVEVSQDINFTFTGNCVVQSDGSVKVTEGEASHIALKEGMRYGKIVLTFGEVHFAEKAELWYVNKVNGEGWGAQLYNWLTVGKTRLRAEGTVSTGHGLRIDKDSYMSKDYSITLDELNAMTSYEMDIYPDAEDASHLHMDFYYNGTVKCEAQCMNPFYGNELVGDETYVGTYTSSTTADTWFVVKTCDVTPIE